MVNKFHPSEEFDDNPDVVCAVACLHRNGLHNEARDFQEHYGGTRLYVPVRPSSKDRIVKIVGMKAAQILANEIGGIKIYVPMGANNPYLIKQDHIALFSLAKISAPVIAIILGMGERSVYFVRRKLRDDGIDLPSATRLSPSNSSARKVK
jgi:hypothetical protein